MFQLEIVNPALKKPFLEGPVRFLPNPVDIANDLSGIDLGKFFSRTFHLKGIIRKTPRILAGAATGALMGGGWSGAIAGGLTAAAFRRKAGTSLFQDIYRGGLYGMIGGTAVGAGKIALGRSSEAGLLGTGYEYITKTFFGPKPTIQYDRPIGPELPLPNTGSIGSSLPTETNMWSGAWKVAKDIIPKALPVVTKFGEKTLDYMTAQQQAKAAEYTAAMAQVAQGESMGLPGENPYAIPFGVPSGMPYGVGPVGVPSDISSGPSGGPSGAPSGGTAFPVEQRPETFEEPMVQEGITAGVPTWIVLGGGGLVLLLLLTR